MSVLLQVASFYLLRFHIRLGQGGRYHGSVPTLHVLSGHGHRSVQSVSPLLAARALRQIELARQQQSVVDPPRRDRLHVVLLVSVRVLPALVYAPDLDDARRLRASLPHHHHAAPRSDHLVSLGHVGVRAGRIGILRPTAATDHDGRRLSGVA